VTIVAPNSQNWRHASGDANTKTKLPVSQQSATCEDSLCNGDYALKHDQPHRRYTYRHKLFLNTWVIVKISVQKGQRPTYSLQLSARSWTNTRLVRCLIQNNIYIPIIEVRLCWVRTVSLDKIWIQYPN